jgi:hypothetical protein
MACGAVTGIFGGDGRRGGFSNKKSLTVSYKANI